MNIINETRKPVMTFERIRNGQFLQWAKTPILKEKICMRQISRPEMLYNQRRRATLIGANALFIIRRR